jgi:hypothetical protein
MRKIEEQYKKEKVGQVTIKPDQHRFLPKASFNSTSVILKHGSHLRGVVILFENNSMKNKHT